jgi:GT2 family glycosyltransferase
MADATRWLSVSVVIPTYNRAALLPRALASALGQCAPGDEIIVVDDGSTDETEQAIAPFRDRIQYLKVANGGAGKARNIGVRRAKNALVAFLDSDDEWLPWKLRLQRAFLMARPEPLFCFSDIGVRFHWGADIRHAVRHRYKDREIGKRLFGEGVPFSTLAPLPEGVSDFSVHVGDLYHAEMSNSHIVTSTLVVRRDQAGDALFFAEDLPTYEDWECFGRLAAKGPAAYLDCETAWLHQHDRPQLTKADALTNATARLAVLERVWGRDPAYLSAHAEEFRAVVREQRLVRLRKLLALARGQEARAELRRLPDPPRSLRLLARFPAPALRLLILARQSLAGGDPGGDVGLT